jgi:mRNA interferase MazF
VAEFVGGDVVVVPFPFTDLQASKRRPAVVLATFARGDLLICQVASRSESHPTTVAIGTDDFLRGGIDRTSVALSHRLVTVHETGIRPKRDSAVPLTRLRFPDPAVNPRARKKARKSLGHRQVVDTTSTDPAANSARRRPGP